MPTGVWLDPLAALVPQIASSPLVPTFTSAPVAVGFTAPPPSITGTVAQRLGGLRQAASGGLSVSGTVAQQIGGLRQALVGSAFTPTQLPGLLLWLRGDLGISLNAGNVSAWADQSGNGNNATQATAIRQPPPNTAINGLACVAFDGTRALQLPNFISTGAKTIVIVRKYAAATGINQNFLILETGATETKVSYVSADVSGPYSPMQFYADWTASINGQAVAPVMDAAAHMNYIDYTGGTNTLAASYDAYIDGTISVLSGGGAYGDGAITNKSAIGARISSAGVVSPTTTATCSVAEIIICSGQLSAANRNKLGGYVQTRYAITVAGATF